MVVEDRQISKVCERCNGDCCKAINLIIKPAPKMKELLGIHYGWETDDIETVQITLKHTCPHLLPDGRCDLWHADPEQDQRPPYCQEYLCDKALNPGVLILEVSET